MTKCPYCRRRLPVPISEAARMLGVSADTILRMINEGDIKAKRDDIGGMNRWVIKVEEIERVRRREK